MAKQAQLTCSHDGCSARFAWTPGRGGKPKFCPEHRPAKNRARDLRLIAAREGADRAAQVAAETGRAPPTTGESDRVQLERLAIYLGITEDPMEAAELAQIPVTSPKAIRALAKRAQKRFPGLVALSKPELLKHATANVALLSLELRNSIGSSNPQRPAMIGAALKAAQAVASQLGGGMPHAVPYRIVFGNTPEKK